MALFVIVNYFGVKWFARVNNTLVWWKLAIILVVIAAFLLTAFHGENFTSHGSPPRAGTGCSPRSPRPASCSPTSASGRASSWPARPTTRSATCPIAVVGSVLLTAVIYIALQFAFIGALPPGLLDKGWANLSFENDFGPLAATGHHPRPGLALDPAVRRRDHLPGRHRPDLHHHDVADLLRHGAQRQRPQEARLDDRPRRAAVQPDRGVRRRADRVPAVPELAAAGRLHHLGDGAVLRVRPAGDGRAAQADPGRTSGRSGCPAGT